MRIPSSFIHHPVVVKNQALIETKLPAGHTKAERLAELEEMAKTHADVEGMGLVIAMKLEQLGTFTEEAYAKWSSDYEAIKNAVRKLEEDE